MNLQKILEKEVGFIKNLDLPDLKKVRLYQLVYRALDFDSQIYSVLHGSTVITKNGNVVLFGDGVDCVGKTTCATWAAKGGKWIVDEFSLYNDLTGQIYGNDNMPIMIKKDSLKHSPLEIETEEPVVHIGAEEAGYTVESMGKLQYIISPHFSPEYKNVLKKEEDIPKKMKKLGILANAHRLKFSFEGLDRGDGNKITSEQIELVDFMFGYAVPNSLVDIPFYDAYLTDSKHILDLLEKEVI